MHYRISCLVSLGLLTLSAGLPAQTPAQLERIAALEARLGTLQGEAAQVEAAHDIARLQSRYAYYLEQGMADEIADLFADSPDVAVEFGIRGIYRGRDSIRDFFERYHDEISSKGMYNHLSFQPYITVAPDAQTAEARFRGLVLSGIHGEEDGWQEGPYENDYVLENGEWKFSRIHWYTTLIAPYDEGWHRAPQPMPGPFEDLPPDAPPSEQYQSFPQVHLPPYHYDNPVTGEPAPTPVSPGGADRAAQDGDAMARLDALQRRVGTVNETAARVEDLNELESLQRKFSYYLDKMLWEDVLSLFTEDAVLQMGPGGEYQGRDSISDYFYSLSDGEQGPLEGVMYNHFMIQPVITLGEEGEKAQARWRTLMQLGTYGDENGGQWGAGPYENEYRKVDGEWKISSLRWFPEFIAPYDEGWSHADPALVEDYSISPTTEPDAPGDNAFEGTDTTRPPFHWMNEEGAQ